MFTIEQNLQRLPNETDFEWKLRLCLQKKRKVLDYDWIEIRDALGLDITPDQLRKQAVGYYEYDNYINGFDGVATTILSISDLHVPFQLPIETLKEYINKVDILHINGDVVDCQSLSRFDKHYRISPMQEIIDGRQYLIDLIKYVNPKKVICNYGNHDIRFANYLSKNLDSDILQLQPNTSLELIFDDGFRNYDKQTGTKTWYEPICNLFDGIEIKFVNDWKCKIGKTWFAHPIAYRQSILGTADKANEYFHNTDQDGFQCIVLAHTHQVGDTRKGYVRLIEQGAFAHTEKMKYMDGKLTKPQKQGFAIICQDKDGNLINDKTKVVVLN